MQLHRACEEEDEGGREAKKVKKNKEMKREMRKEESNHYTSGIEPQTFGLN